jgi:hypothetical protein
MGNRLFRLGRCTLLAGFAVAVNSAFGAYLPQLGPSPLRFCPSPSFTATVAIFPALRIDDSASPTNSGTVSLATNIPPAESLEPLGPPAPPPAESAALGATNSVTELASAQPPVILPDGTPRITPQMLVDFFKPVLNGTNAVPVIAPPGTFTPPSSSATYKSN